MKSFAYTIFMIFTLKCYAQSIAFIGGQDNTTNTPLIYILPSFDTTPTLIPTTDQGFINTSAVAPNGTALLAGESLSGSPLAYRILLNSTTLIPISFSGVVSASILEVAINQMGSALLVGQDSITDHPVIYELDPNSTTAQAKITVPFPESHTGSFNAVFFGPDGSAIIVGNDTTSQTPVIYRLPSGATTALLINNPNSDLGALSDVSIDINNTAIIVGENNTTHQPLMYRLLSTETTAQLIQNPDSDLGSLAAVSIASDGTTAVAVGADNHDGTFTTPLGNIIYNNAPAAFEFPIPGNIRGQFNSIAVAPSNNAVAAGRNITTGQPLVFRRLSGYPFITLMNNPNQDHGFINVKSADIATDGTAVFGGQDTTTGTPLIYRLPLDETTCSLIPLANDDGGVINTVTIYSFPFRQRAFSQTFAR